MKNSLMFIQFCKFFILFTFKKFNKVEILNFFFSISYLINELRRLVHKAALCRDLIVLIQFTILCCISLAVCYNKFSLSYLLETKTTFLFVNAFESFKYKW